MPESPLPQFRRNYRLLTKVTDRSKHQTTETDPGHQYFNTASCGWCLGTVARNFGSVLSINDAWVTIGVHLSLFRIYDQSNGSHRPLHHHNGTASAIFYKGKVQGTPGDILTLLPCTGEVGRLQRASWRTFVIISYI